MPFREKEPVRMDPFRLPFIRRISETILPEGYYWERISSNLFSEEQSGIFYRVNGEQIITGWFSEAMGDQTEKIPDPKVKDYPYLSRRIV